LTRKVGARSPAAPNTNIFYYFCSISLDKIAGPEIPLHNNPVELAARLRVRKRVVSYGPRSAVGAQTWDAMETLLGTARKLGVNFFQYLRDRVSGAMQMPSLAELIKQRASMFDLSPSWRRT
jgi:hypothetical protein